MYHPGRHAKWQYQHTNREGNSVTGAYSYQGTTDYTTVTKDTETNQSLTVEAQLSTSGRLVQSGSGNTFTGETSSPDIDTFTTERQQVDTNQTLHLETSETSQGTRTTTSSSNPFTARTPPERRWRVPRNLRNRKSTRLGRGP